MSPGPPPFPPPGPPRPQEHAPLARAISGPLLLITLGILLELSLTGRMSFARTWPALLIVFGACKLVEHLKPRNL